MVGVGIGCLHFWFIIKNGERVLGDCGLRLTRVVEARLRKYEIVLSIFMEKSAVN